MKRKKTPPQLKNVDLTWLTGLDLRVSFYRIQRLFGKAYCAWCGDDLCLGDLVVTANLTRRDDLPLCCSAQCALREAARFVGELDTKKVTAVAGPTEVTQ